MTYALQQGILYGLPMVQFQTLHTGAKEQNYIGWSKKSGTAFSGA